MLCTLHIVCGVIVTTALLAVLVDLAFISNNRHYCRKWKYSFCFLLLLDPSSSAQEGGRDGGKHRGVHGGVRRERVRLFEIVSSDLHIHDAPDFPVEPLAVRGVQLPQSLAEDLRLSSSGRHLKLEVAAATPVYCQPYCVSRVLMFMHITAIVALA